MTGVEGGHLHPAVAEALAAGVKLSEGKHRLKRRQEEVIDGLVACYGDAMVKVHEAGHADVFHLEHPMELAWSVSPTGNVGKWAPGEEIAYTHSADEVATW